MQPTTLGRTIYAGAEMAVQTAEPTELDLANTSVRRVAERCFFTIKKIATQAGLTREMAINPLKGQP
jgi:hypothetical protein